MTLQWHVLRRGVRALLPVGLAVLLVACGSVRPRPFPVAAPQGPAAAADRNTAPAAAPGAVVPQAKSRWVAASWSELPGFDQDDWFDAWSAWVRSCERASGIWTAVCPQVRSMSIASDAEQRDWLQKNFQAYRVESSQGDPNGRLTGYFEPELVASRVATSVFNVPLYQPPAGLNSRRPWYTRKEVDTLPAA